MMEKGGGKTCMRRARSLETWASDSTHVDPIQPHQLGLGLARIPTQGQVQTTEEGERGLD